MAVQTIYTGRGAEAPQVRGYALQALSQFGQQEQARKTMEIENAVKDRDAFAKMLELDPVYASSAAAQDRIASIMDGYIDEMTMMNKKRKGPMTTQDLMKMQQARGRAISHMGYIKAANDEFVQSAKMYNAAPWKYDTETWTEYQETWLKEGVRPETPPLLPAAQDPIAVGLQNLMDTGLKYEYSDVKRENISEREDRVTQVGRWNIPYNVPMEDIISRSISRDQPWNIQKTFRSNKVSDAERRKYISMANGDEVAAANMRYYNQMEAALQAEDTRYKSYSARRDYVSPIDRESMKTRFSDNDSVYIYDNDAVFQKGYQELALGDPGDGMSIIKPMLINIPADQLEFTEDVQFDPGSRIWVQPQQVTFKNGKVEYALDPTKNGEVWITASNEDDLPFDKVLEAIDLPGGKKKYRGVLKALTALGDVEDTRSLMKYDFGEVYDKWKSEWESKQGEKPKEQAKEEKKFKWLNPSTWFNGETNKAVFSIQGEEYTEDELRQGGWTDKDIAELKKRGNG